MMLVDAHVFSFASGANLLNNVIPPLSVPIFDAVTSDWTLDEIQLFCFIDGVMVSSYNYPYGISGNYGGPSAPGQIAVCMRWKGIRKWWIHGQRFLMPGISLDHMDGMRLNSAGIAAWQPVADALTVFANLPPAFPKLFFWSRKFSIVSQSNQTFIPNSKLFDMHRRRDKGVTSWPFYPNFPP